MRAVQEPTMRSSWWVVEEPTYVVDLMASSAHAAERWRLSDVDDVSDVLEWVRRHQRHRVATISVEVSDEYGLMLVPLTRLASVPALA
ncbi:hypothetical protein [Cellulomonas sp. URHB0016]